jgi:hypothetical protein
VPRTKGAGPDHCGDNGGARKLVDVGSGDNLVSSNFQINRVLTADDAFGCPWPPSDLDGWTVVRRIRGFTLWRSIKIAQPVPPPHGCAFFLVASKQVKGLKDDE